MPKFRSLLLRFADDPDNQGGGDKSSEKKPTSDMTPEERIEFEEKAKRRYQDKLKAFDGKTPEDVKKLEQELEALRQEKLTEQEKAVEEAAKNARAEASTTAASSTVDAVLKVALRGRTADAAAMLELDRSQFITEDSADTEKILAWVEEHSTAMNEKRLPVKTGAGSHERLEVSAREAGRAAAQKRFGKKND